jgi:hypothetical protein
LQQISATVKGVANADASVEFILTFATTLAAIQMASLSDL